MAFAVVINGESRTFPGAPDSLTLTALLAELQLTPDRVAVEHNGGIVPRTQWPQHAIHTGDRLEIVHFVGGGTS